jgi:hypothetical protein
VTLPLSEEALLLQLADGDTEHFKVLEQVLCGWPLREHCATVRQISLELLARCSEDTAVGYLDRAEADANRSFGEQLAQRPGGLVFGRRTRWVLTYGGETPKLDPSRIDPYDYVTRDDLLAILHRTRLGLPGNAPYQVAVVVSATVIPAGRS